MNNLMRAKKRIWAGVCAMMILGAVPGLLAQERGPGPGGPGPGGGFGPKELEVVKQFDRDADMRLNLVERAAARKHVREIRQGEGPRFGPGGPGPRPGGNLPAPQPGQRMGVGDVPHNTTADFYDAGVLRTLFLDFENEDWAEELSDFARTDVEVPARLIVDGRVYPKVGVKIRGNTSSMFVGEGRKKPLGVAIDYEDPDLRLYGYKTLNLLNAHTDPTLMREVLFNHVARNYLPAAKANYVRVVMNGESWGIYVNSQQFNNEFLSEWFDSRKGVRWKVPADPREGGGLGYRGEERAAYEGRYELKSSEDDDRAWKDLIEVSRVLAQAPLAELETALEPRLAIDRTLWFMALDNVFVDNDGYWVRASDFLLYQDKTGRFHPIPHDNNETFQEPHLGPGSGRQPVELKGVELDPLFGIGDASKPFLRLLEVPHLRARYLAHVRTLAREWLNWGRIEPLVRQNQGLIGEDVKNETRNLYDHASFLKGVTGPVEEDGPGPRGRRRIIGLKEFVEQRAQYLLNHPEVKAVAPVIGTVVHRVKGASRDPLTTDRVEVTASLGSGVSAERVVLYYAESRTARFQAAAMTLQGQGVYRGEIPPMPAGTEVHYYVEARGGGAKPASSFFPTGTEFGARTYKVGVLASSGSPVIISEVMASNTSTLADPQGQFDDWVELQNLGGQELDLSGMYLSDKVDNPRKWRIPDGTRLPAGGQLVIWADEDGKKAGLHANFKLSKQGEALRLHDTDQRGNTLLDSIEFGALGDDQAFGRTGREDKGRILPAATPGRPNR